MARIRTIKPEFFTSSDITSLTPLSRLFYVSLWCEADREGRLKWDLKTLRVRYLPEDDCSIIDLSNELVEAGLVVIYEVDGKQYAEIPSFKSHQVINNRESQSTLPSRVKDASARVQGERKGRERKGKEQPSETQDIPEAISSEVWNEWIAYRVEKKDPLSPRSIKMQIADLVSWSEKGHDPNQIIRASISNGWKGLFEPKGKPVNPPVQNKDATPEQQQAEFLKKIGYM
jgi:hypothetical protein